MKNKHLVLLFLFTLLVGLAVRRAPWRHATFFQTKLLKLDTASIQQIQITLPNKPTLFLLRSDIGWSAEQEERSVVVEPYTVNKILGALADMRSIRIAKTDLPDTLGFIPTAKIQLTVVHSNAQSESITIGWETIENSQAATYVQLPRHEGIYLVDNHLRNIFAKKLTDFRKQTIIQFTPEAVRSFSIAGPNLDSIIFVQNDSSGMWEGGMISQVQFNDQVQNWLSKIRGLDGLAFADLFDESHANESLYARIRLNFKEQSEPLILETFLAHQIYVPETFPSQKLDRRQFAPYVLHSSQNPTNYFAFPDTVLLRQICHPFK